eukprot:scaffold137727_cov66-Phaeocystis_antarctica.AAC.1
MKKLSPEERKKVSRCGAAGTCRPLGFLLSNPCSNRSAHLHSGRDTARCTRSTAKRCGYRERAIWRPLGRRG